MSGFQAYFVVGVLQGYVNVPYCASHDASCVFEVGNGALADFYVWAVEIIERCGDKLDYFLGS